MSQAGVSGIFRKGVLAAVLISVGVLFGVACGSPEEVTPPSAATPVDQEAEGRLLYLDKGCAVCHGQNGEGTSIAPSLPGHNEEQIRRQVRNPLGNMPRSDIERISDDELEMIADYIGSLALVDEHIEPLAMEDALVMHHLMALNALESDNQDEAAHHVSHVIDLVTDREHQSMMEDILMDIGAGDHHDAGHAIKEMIVTKAEPGLAMERLHLQLALASIGGHDSADAAHHVDHYVVMVTGDELKRAEEILELLEQGNLHDAEHEIGELLE